MTSLVAHFCSAPLAQHPIALDTRDTTPSAAIIDSQSVKTTEKWGLGATTLANG